MRWVFFRCLLASAFCQCLEVLENPGDWQSFVPVKAEVKEEQSSEQHGVQDLKFPFIGDLFLFSASPLTCFDGGGQSDAIWSHLVILEHLTNPSLEFHRESTGLKGP